MGWNGRFVVTGWDGEMFYLRPPRMHDDKEDMAVEPLKIMLHDEEMQAWIKDPKGMDQYYEPDLMRPGKFKSKAARRS